MKLKYALLFVLVVAIHCANSEQFLYYIPYSCVVYALLLSLTNAKVSIFIKFLTAIFLLGNWAKVTVHGIFDYPYVEATGSFSGTQEQWENFYLFSFTISIALLVSALASAMIVPANKMRLGNSKKREIKKSFRYASVIFIFTIYALNWKYGFYRVGVGRDFNLPYGLNAPASFMVYLGAPMLTAILAANSVVKRRLVTPSALAFLAVVSIAAAIVTYSRVTIAVILLPIAMGMYQLSKEINGKSQPITGLLVVIGPALVVVLASVSLMRILVYGNAETFSAESLEIYLYESIGLFIDRWIGAEGLMVAVSSPQSLDFFLQMIAEDPAAGMQGIYQNFSNSQYLNLFLENMTFLTLPGAFAILAFSGSFFITFFGVVVMSAIGVSLERYVGWAFRGQYALQFLITANLAYHFSQMVFPLLFIPFIVQVFFFTTLLGLYYSASRRR